MIYDSFFVILLIDFFRLGITHGQFAILHALGDGVGDDADGGGDGQQPHGLYDLATGELRHRARQKKRINHTRSLCLSLYPQNRALRHIPLHLQRG